MRINNYSVINNKYSYIENKICFSNKNKVQHVLSFSIEDLSQDSPTDVDLYFVDFSGDLYKIDSTFDMNTNSVTFYTDWKETEYSKIFLKIKIDGDLTYIDQFLDVPMIDIKSNERTFIVYKPITVSKESNLFYSKASAYVPSWSKAYKQYGSNYSKIVEPYFKLLQGFYNTLDYNLTDSIEYKSFSYEEDLFKLYDQSGAQLLEHTSLLSGSVKTCDLINNDEQLNLEELYIDSTTILKNHTLPFTSKLYLSKSKGASITVIIEGIDENNRYVNEPLTLIGDNPVATKHKYKIIKSFLAEAPVVISNYLDCFSNHFIVSDNPTPMPLLIDKKSYSIFYPDIKIEAVGNSTALGIYNKQECVYRYFFRSPNIKGVFVDKYLNVHWIENNKLYMNSLSIDLSQYSNNSYENSSEFIDYDYTDINDWIEITIDFSKLNKKTAIVSMSDEDSTYYLNTETKQPQIEKYVIQNADSLGIFSFKVLPESFPLTVSLITKEQTYPVCISPLILDATKSSSFNIDASVERLAIVNDTLTLLKNSSPTSLESLEDDLVLIFNSEMCSGINFKIEMNSFKIDNFELPLPSDYISRYNLKHSSTAIIYKINVDGIKKEFFKSENIVFSVKAFKEDNTFINNTSECSVSIFANGTSKGTYPLTVDTNEGYEYTFLFDSSMNLQEI